MDATVETAPTTARQLRAAPAPVAGHRSRSALVVVALLGARPGGCCTRATTRAPTTPTSPATWSPSCRRSRARWSRSAPTRPTWCAPGRMLVRLDATDARIALQDAEQQLARTVRQTRTVFANRDQLEAVVGQRRADLARAQADFDRRKDLAASGAVSAEELGHARDALNAARDALTAAQKNLAAGLALIGRTGVADNPDVQAAATQVERAWLALQRTSVHAPGDRLRRAPQRAARRAHRSGRAADGDRAARAAVGRSELQGSAADAHAHRPAGQGGQRPVRRAHRVSRPRRRARPRHRRGLRAAAGAERHRQLDQGGAARAGARRARAARARGAPAAHRPVHQGDGVGGR